MRPWLKGGLIGLSIGIAYLLALVIIFFAIDLYGTYGLIWFILAAPLAGVMRLFMIAFIEPFGIDPPTQLPESLAIVVAIFLVLVISFVLGVFFGWANGIMKGTSRT